MTLPQRSYGLLLEDRCGTVAIIEVDDAEVWFRTRIVGYGDAAASSRRSVPAILAVAAVTATRPVGCANAARTASATSAAFSSVTPVASV